MDLKVKDFNFRYDRKINKYLIYTVNEDGSLSIYKKYELDYMGRISQNILNDISDLTLLGFRYNPTLK